VTKFEIGDSVGIDIDEIPIIKSGVILEKNVGGHIGLFKVQVEYECGRVGSTLLHEDSLS